MTDNLQNIYFADGYMRCRRCDAEGNNFKEAVSLDNLVSLAELGARHVAAHAAEDADRDVKTKAPLGELDKVLSELQSEITEFTERIVSEYAPRVQKALAQQFGFGKFF